ncbi:MAG: DNA-protecting protein DprA [Bacteroidetes bacterium]|nr:DNA-protecting protein DprA [Bacteroidota bacterium]
MNKDDDEQLMYKLALHLLPGIGPVSARNLVSYCGGVKEVFHTRKGELEKIPFIGTERAKEIIKYKSFQELRIEVEHIRKNNIQTLFYLDKEYPQRLKNCEDAPVLLFYKGNADLNAQKIISVVGTRHITTYGKEATDKLIKEISEYQPLIVSGLAYGVDIQAHKAALKNNLQTVGVVAHGLDKMYPADNAATAEKMLLNGGLLSEYIHGTKPTRDNFPARNRIVAGLTDAVIVIESATRGGALITADIANSYNRDVFALPGRINDIYSKGCHALIRQNKAMIFENAADIADAMNWNVKEKTTPQKQMQLFHDFHPDEQAIIQALNIKDLLSIDEIALTVMLPVSKVSSILLNLEFSGVLTPLPGKIFKLNQ